MKVIDAYILARTKRKTRRIRLAMVIIVSSLLFAVLFFGALVFDGMQRSSSRFEDYRYNGRNVTQLVNYGNPHPGDTVQQGIKDQMDSELRSRKVKVTDEVRNNAEYVSEFADRMFAKLMATAQEKQDTYQKDMVAKYKPSAVYHMKTIPGLQSLPEYDATDPDPYLTQQTKQIETGTSDKNPSNQFTEPPVFFSVEQGMIEPLLQSGQSFAWKPGDPYPVVLPHSYTERLAQKSFVGLSGDEKIAGYQKLITEYTGKTLSYCYRNSTAQAQLDSVLEYNRSAKTDKDTATKPLAVSPCTGFDQNVLKKAGLITKEDPDAPKPLFPKPAAPAPETRTISIKIVGFVPTLAVGPGTDLFASVFSSVNSWPTNMPVIMPEAVVQAEPLLSASTIAFSPYGPASLYFDFKTRAEQKRFIDAEGCAGNECYNGGKWVITPFGNVKTALEGVFATLVKAGKWVALGIAILAALLVLSTINKLVSDNRREIAVFRALGARQRDIAQIYFTYGCMLAMNALVVSLGLAAVGAYVFSAQLADRFNAALVQAVGAYENPGSSVLVGVQPLWLLVIAGVFFVAAMVGVAVPVFMGRRRNLVTIMREE